MAIIQFGVTNKRKEEIDRILPKQPLVTEFMRPVIMALNKKWVPVLKLEIEIYKAMLVNRPEKPKEPETFDPRSNMTCFMGKGFERNGGTGSFMEQSWTDWELEVYRKRVGTIKHARWGKCTLLEIWGADHFTDYPDMVRVVFEYTTGTRDKLPKLMFVSSPILITELTGKKKLTKEQVEAKRENENIIADGVRVAMGIKLKKNRNKLPDDGPVEEEFVDEDDD